MKKVMIYLASLCVAAMAISCEKTVEINQSEEQATPQLTTITCEFPTMVDQNGTKVSIAADGTTGWVAGDKIVIYGKRRNADPDHPELDKVIHELTAAEVADPKKAVFTVDLSGLEVDDSGNYPYNAMYPADESDPYLPFYSKWGTSGRTRFKGTNDNLMAGWVDGSGTMTLENLCGVISFTVTGDYDSYYFSGFNGTETVGYGQLLCELNNSENDGTDEDETYLKISKYGNEWGTNTPLTVISGPVKGDGSLNYIFLPYKANLSDGFTIELAKKGKKVKRITSKQGLNLTHGHMINLGLLPSGALKDITLLSTAEISNAVDLSADKSANCYVVSAADGSNASKVFKFKTVQGNSFVNGSSAGESVGTPYVATVLWETRNTTASISAKSVIDVAEYINGYVYFKMPAELHDGNAVIAVQDENGVILWSWHIWVPATNYGSVTAFDKTFMDRNLGALVVAGTGDPRGIGLMYQWGRKDPFVSRGAKGSSTLATVAGTAKTVSTTELTYEQAVANPTQFSIAANGDKYHWIDTYSTSLWGSAKTVNDPCPAGWRVPHRDETSFFTSDFTSTYVYDSDNECVTIGSLVFPLNGRLYYTTGSESDRSNMYVWSSKCSSNGLARWLRATSSKCVYADERAACGVGVRCIAE